jgi:hypothetical protein
MMSVFVNYLPVPCSKNTRTTHRLLGSLFALLAPVSQAYRCLQDLLCACGLYVAPEEALMPAQINNVRRNMASLAKAEENSVDSRGESAASGKICGETRNELIHGLHKATKDRADFLLSSDQKIAV